MCLLMIISAILVYVEPAPSENLCETCGNLTLEDIAARLMELEVEVVSLTMQSQMINQAALPRQKHKKEKPIRKTSLLPKRTLPKRRKNRAFILIS